MTKYPSLKRPVQHKVESFAGALSGEEALLLCKQFPELKAVVEPVILSEKPAVLLKTMLQHNDTAVRRLAASYLATMGKSNKSLLPAMLKAYDFQPRLEDVVWKGGPLYVPSVSWDRENGTALFEHLLAWYLFCSENGRVQEKQQVYNNIRSVSLLRAIGMPIRLPQATEELLLLYGRKIGKGRVEQLLKEQNIERKYQAVLAQLN